VRCFAVLATMSDRRLGVAGCAVPVLFPCTPARKDDFVCPGSEPRGKRILRFHFEGALEQRQRLGGSFGVAV
jgi:hypothetical protein